MICFYCLYIKKKYCIKKKLKDPVFEKINQYLPINGIDSSNFSGLISNIYRMSVSFAFGA